MTKLDRDEKLAGYYPSIWPVECGGPRRQKLVSSPGLGLKDGEQLRSTTRQMDGWAVMQVQRAPSGTPSISGMFFCPGFERDFYSGPLGGAIARYSLEG